MELINEDYLTKLIEKIMRRLFPKVEEDLTGQTISIEAFRKKYCRGQSAEPASPKNFDRYPEIVWANGGWCVKPHKKSSKTIIFGKPASPRTAEHDSEINWNEKLAN